MKVQTTSKPSVVCRRVDLNMTDALIGLENACFECDRISRRNLRRLLCSPSALCIGAFLGKELTGSMVVLFRSNSSVARIYSLAVSPHARGLGIGKRMIAKAEQEARARKCRCLRLEVRLDNPAAIRLYERCGLTHTKVLPEYYEDGTNALVFWKELD
ncbi:MAG: GNAT family N-acetyltransferase [Kiritimatiellales bacterium]|nr:GNAT family N-acetyltransferase [Kiritimatiellales bacterium]